MLRSGRGKRIAAVLASTLGLAVVVCALIYGLSQQFYYVQAANDAAAEYSRYTAYQEKKACRGVSAVQLSQCRADAKAEYSQKRADNRREYDDLVAQQTSALWTNIMGFAAITGMVLSVVGIYLVYTTFKETKAANVIARQSAIDAAADAKRSHDALIASDRAIVFVRFAQQDEPIAPDGLRTVIHFQLENQGKSNAYGFQIFAEVQSEPLYKPRARFSYLIDKICGAGAKVMCEIKIKTPKKFPAYLVGYVQYSTMGDVNFMTYFCFRIDQTVSYDKYGDAVGARLEKAHCQRLPAMA